jgi:hypothetical protein
MPLRTCCRQPGRGLMPKRVGWDQEITFRSGVKPLRFAVHAPPNPGVTVLGYPLNAWVRRPEAAGKASLLCTPRTNGC